MYALMGKEDLGVLKGTEQLNAIQNNNYELMYACMIMMFTCFVIITLCSIDAVIQPWITGLCRISTTIG